MRFPRNTKIFRGQLDASPYAGVLFLLVLFLLLNSSLVFVPGIPLQLPTASGLAGMEGPTIQVAVDASGQFYFENQVIDEARLSERLKEAARNARPLANLRADEADRVTSPETVTLVVKADAEVKYKVLARLWLMARAAGITNMLQATQPPVIPKPDTRQGMAR